MTENFTLDQAVLAEYCTRWRIAEFALFGSVLRDDFRPDSDVDVLITLAPDAAWDLFDWVAMKQELEGLLGRRVDLVEKSTLRNPYRRKAIMASVAICFSLGAEARLLTLDDSNSRDIETELDNTCKRKANAT